MKKILNKFKRKEFIFWGCIVVVATGVIVGVTLAQDQGVPKPPTPVYTGPVSNPNATYGTAPTAVSSPAVSVNKLTPAGLKQAENALQQTICDAFPATASQFPNSMYDLGVQVPDNFNTQIAGLGDSLTFGTAAMQAYSTYNNKNYFKCFGNRNLFTTGARNCLLNFTAKFSDGTSESGLISMTYTGQVSPYQPQNAVPVNSDGAVPKNPYAGMDPAPMLSRSNCSVIFQKPCPTKANSVLCGQCDVKYAGTDLVSKPENLGKCFYCAGTQKCTWGAGGLCSSYSCVNKTNSNTKKAVKYFTSCSGCQKSGYYRNYNYNGTNRATCQNYLRVCRACGAINVKTNCK